MGVLPVLFLTNQRTPLIDGSIASTFLTNQRTPLIDWSIASTFYTNLRKNLAKISFRPFLKGSIKAEED